MFLNVASEVGGEAMKASIPSGILYGKKHWQLIINGEKHWQLIYTNSWKTGSPNICCLALLVWRPSSQRRLLWKINSVKGTDSWTARIVSCLTFSWAEFDAMRLIWFCFYLQKILWHQILEFSRGRQTWVPRGWHSVQGILYLPRFDIVCIYVCVFVCIWQNLMMLAWFLIVIIRWRDFQLGLPGFKAVSQVVRIIFSLFVIFQSEIIRSLSGKYGIFFYGTYETASLKASEIWPFNEENATK